MKVLKPEYLLKAIDKHEMDQAIIFCRTKLDCDNVEDYLKSRGGGRCGQRELYDSICIASYRIVIFIIIITRCKKHGK